MTGTTTPSELAHEYGEARRRMSDLVADAGATVVSTRIPACPEWSVHALCSHVTGIAADLTARRNPGPDVQAWVDGQIAERADRALADVLAEWAEVGPQFEALIERKPAGFGGLLYDLIAHEHDLRGAIGVPVARDSAGLAAAMEMERAMLDRDLAVHDLAAVRLLAAGHEFVAGEGDVELTLDLDDRADGLFELFRALGSRRSRAQLGTLPWQGDLDRFLPALAHMPLPDHDLTE